MVQPATVKAQTKNTLPIIQTSNPLITFNMTMDSPQNNTAYTNNLVLDFLLQINSSLSLTHVSLGLSVFYRIDNNSEVYLSSDQNYYELIDITNLTNGIHQLTILAQMNYVYDNSIVQNKQELQQKTYFLVLNKPATIHLQSPQQIIYFTDTVPLIFEFDDPSTYPFQRRYYLRYWQGYSLDNGNRELQTTNGQLTGLPDGFHTITFYIDIGNMSSSSKVYFFVIATPFAQILLITVIALVPLIVFISLLLYSRHRKTQVAP